MLALNVNRYNFLKLNGVKSQPLTAGKNLTALSDNA
jgi:hypothetical protein